MNDGAKLRVLLADEQSLFREAVKVVLSAEDDFEVVAEARDGIQAVSIATTAAQKELISLALLLFAAACRDDKDPQRVRPRQLRDVPARALAFNFQADVEPRRACVVQPRVSIAIGDEQPAGETGERREAD